MANSAMCQSGTSQSSLVVISIMMTSLPSVISQGGIQYPASIQTKGASSPASAQVELRYYDNFDQIFFTYEVEIDMGSKIKLAAHGSTEDGAKTLFNGQVYEEAFSRLITQKVTKSKDADFIYLSVYLQTTLKYADGKEKYGETTIGVKVSLGRRGHIWDIHHENSNNYEVEGKGDLCLGCDVEKVEKQVEPVRPSCPPLSVNCQGQEVSRGVSKYVCAVPEQSKDCLTLSYEHILWLRGLEGERQQLDIVIPNYRVEELIRAALKASKGGSTNVNILLKKPETVYDIQAQDGGQVRGSKPVVNLQYEEVARPQSIHYPTDQAYNPLSGPIREL